MMTLRRPTLLAPTLLSLAVLASACGGADDDVAPSADGRTGTSVVVTAGDEATAETGGGSIVDDDATTTTEPSDDAAETDAEPTDSTDTDAEPTGSAADAPTWPQARYGLFEVASVDFPTVLTARPGSDHLWVAERAGRVRLVERRPAADGGRAEYALAAEPALDIAELISTDGEGGLLGLAFSADGSFLYTSYTNNRGDSVLAEYRMTGDEADPESGRILIEVEQPFANHNGGQVSRGPDDLLWFALGDGGSGGDPLNSGQDTSTLLGSILRLDPANPAGEQAYGVPADNPFSDGAGGRPEIWLYGVRNPWRFSFDRATDDLWIGDVGQNAVEEITFIPADGGVPGRGANLGWRLMEGDLPFEGDGPPADHVGPIHTYGRTNGGCSVTGGYVYRGDRIAALDGVYLYGDFCTGQIVGLDRLDDGSLLAGDVVTDRGVASIVSFGQDGDGEVYVLGADGSVSLLEPAG